MSIAKVMRILTIGFIPFISNIGLGQNIDQSHEKVFVANGVSENRIPSEAKLNMLQDAGGKCEVIGGPKQISETVFQLFDGILFASAKFSCYPSALDTRRCWYPDESFPACDYIFRKNETRSGEQVHE
jgi:hypothetical protein